MDIYIFDFNYSCVRNVNEKDDETMKDKKIIGKVDHKATWASKSWLTIPNYIKIGPAVFNALRKYKNVQTYCVYHI